MAVRRSRVWTALGLLALSMASASAEVPAFRQVELAYGVSLEVPAHWLLIEEDERKNQLLAGQTIAGAAGAKNQPTRARLLAVNATPRPTGAMISIGVAWPPMFSQQELAEMSRQDMAEFTREMHSLLRSAEAQGGPRIIEMQGFTVEPLNDRHAMVLRYRRASRNSPSAWQVTQYTIPVDGRVIELSLSYRESDGHIWRPLLTRVKDSLRY